MPVSKSFNPPQVGDRTIEDFKEISTFWRTHAPICLRLNLLFKNYVQVPTDSVANSRFLIKYCSITSIQHQRHRRSF